MALCPSSTSFQKFFVILGFTLFTIFLVLAYLSNSGKTGIFYSRCGAVSEKYITQVTPPDVIFRIIWPIVFIWNFCAIFYILISLFLPEQKSPIHVQPTLISNTFLVSYCVAFIMLIAWVFTYDRELMDLSLTLLVIATVALFIVLGVSYKRVYDNTIYLESKETRVMLWLTRVLIQNGICLMASWLTFAICLNMAIAIIYYNSFGIDPPAEKGPLNVEDGSSVTLAFLFAIVIIWDVLDHVVFENYTRYSFTVFPVFIIAMAGLVARLLSMDPIIAYRNFVFAVSMLAFCCFAFLFRIIFFFFCLKRRRNAN